MKLRILHIAVHLGGGVGTVVKNWIDQDKINDHTILLLNKNYNGNSHPNIHEEYRNNYDAISKFVEDSDIVIVHFWNHPYLFEFLTNAKLPKCRLVIWSHVSAISPPYVHFDKLAGYGDKFILSSIISDVEFIKENKDKIDCIWTTGGINRYLEITKKRDNIFNIGYIGTLDYSKLHPDFVKICGMIHDQIPSSIFTICGSGCDYDNIKNQIKETNLEDVVKLVGMIDISEVLPSFDVFMYPLINTHFGTCEQVLGETMACGIEPVVFNNKAESYIVDSVGWISESIDDFVENVCHVFKNPTTHEQELLLKQRAKSLYTIDKMINSWNNMFIEVMKNDKIERCWDENHYNEFDIFVEALGPYGDVFKQWDEEGIKQLINSSPQWKSANKGSIYQYLDAFPENERLNSLLKYLKS